MYSSMFFTLILSFYSFMGLRIVDQTTFSQIQRSYCLPSIESMWNTVNEKTIEELKGLPLILAGRVVHMLLGHYTGLKAVPIFPIFPIRILYFLYFYNFGHFFLYFFTFWGKSFFSWMNLSQR